MIANFLFEIGTEEIPAKYMPNTLKQLKATISAKLNENRIIFDEIIPVGTPRRVAVFVKGMSTKQSDVNETVKGPSKKVAYDSDGVPSKALNGFMRSHGITENDIVMKQVDGIDYIFTSKIESGKDTKEILMGLLPEVIYSFSFPKSMRWKDYSIRFARPIRWIVALLGKEVIEFSIEGVSSSNITKGHRTLSEGSIVLDCADEYFSRLQDEYVMVAPEVRRETILKQVNELAQSVSGKAIIDEELLNEVVFLVEYPTALVGNFNNEFLDLPNEVVITPMREHQRYFHVVDNEGRLLPYFITVRNGNEEYIDNVRIGNEKVLRARLKDAQFFYQEDLKENLENKVEKLKTVVFQEKLGTVYDKVNRIVMLSEFIGYKLLLTEAQMSKLKRAAYLCKADLVTGMVNEFDELQGIMGKEYALKSGEDPDTAEAIYSHYLPRYSGDSIPMDAIGQILSISDKLDSCVGIFGIGSQPTGSQDSYGLRRSCISIITVIIVSGIHIDIGELIDYSIRLYGDKLTKDRSKLHSIIIDFFRQRIRVGLIDKGFRHDIVDTVLSMNLDDINNIIKRIAEISETQALDARFKDLLTSLTRVFNLASKASDVDTDTNIFENKYEHSLYALNLSTKEEVEQKIRQGHVTGAIKSLYELIDPINAFLENTMVIVENDTIKHNRLSLLNAVADTALQVCDFTKIVVS
jgi:glycyl-tRNA synthetase beta chain